MNIEQMIPDGWFLFDIKCYDSYYSCELWTIDFDENGGRDCMVVSADDATAALTKACQQARERNISKLLEEVSDKQGEK